MPMKCNCSTKGKSCSGYARAIAGERAAVQGVFVQYDEPAGNPAEFESDTEYYQRIATTVGSAARAEVSVGASI